MSLTQNDIGVLVHIAKRSRPLGATKWDDAGIAKFARDLANRGFSWDEILDRVVTHSRDRKAKTPAVLMQPISPQLATPSAPRNPTKFEACEDCGLRRTACVCDPKIPRKPVVDSTEPQVRAALGHARRKIAAAREAATCP